MFSPDSMAARKKKSPCERQKEKEDRMKLFGNPIASASTVTHELAPRG